MKLYHYSKVPNPNFGDGLNEWLWDRLLPAGSFDADDGTFFSGIGTIISARMPDARRWIVFTSGAGYGPPPRDFGSSRWTVVSVRGPLTAEVLGLPGVVAIADGALLLATLRAYAPLPEDKRSGVVFVPHHSVDGDRWREVCAAAGVEYLSPRLPGPEVIERLRGAKLVLADAMHAAIVADTVRVPWVPLVSSPRISTFKWLDWTKSMDVPYAPLALPAASTGAWLGDRLLGFSGDHHHVASGEPAAAITHFSRSRARSLRRMWPATRRFARRVQRNTARIVESAPVARALAVRDRAFRDRLAEVLRAASRGQGFLSEDRVFGSRLDALADRLHRVQSLCRAG